MRDQVITIYNKFGNDKPARWGRRVLTGVHFRYGSGVSLSETGATSGQIEGKVIIPLDNRYCNPDSYNLAEDRSQFWTIQEGDAVIAGEGPEIDGTGHIKSLVPGCQLITGHVCHVYGSRLDHWTVYVR